MTWLRQQGGPTFRVSAIFQWNAGSWDIQGVRHDSYNSQGSWKSDQLKTLVFNHNKYVNNF